MSKFEKLCIMHENMVDYLTNSHGWIDAKLSTGERVAACHFSTGLYPEDINFVFAIYIDNRAHVLHGGNIILEVADDKAGESRRDFTHRIDRAFNDYNTKIWQSKKGVLYSK